MLKYIGPGAAFLTVALTAATAGSVEPCGDRSNIITLLKNDYGEVEAGRGLSRRGYVAELFVSPAGSWTILLSQPSGLSCFADAGEAWTITPPVDSPREASQVRP